MKLSQIINALTGAAKATGAAGKKAGSMAMGAGQKAAEIAGKNPIKASIAGSAAGAGALAGTASHNYDKGSDDAFEAMEAVDKINHIHQQLLRVDKKSAMEFEKQVIAPMQNMDPAARSNFAQEVLDSISNSPEGIGTLME